MSKGHLSEFLEPGNYIITVKLRDRVVVTDKKCWENTVQGVIEQISTSDNAEIIDWEIE